MKRPCIDCGTPTNGSRCRRCTTPDPRSTAGWTRTSQNILAAHRATHGNWCPGTDTHPAHPSTDLTVDHIDPLATTGRDTGRYRVLCRSENSRLGQALQHPTQG